VLYKSKFLANSVPRTHRRCYTPKCGAVQEMRVGPSESTFRSRFQTTLSCAGKEPGWWALRKRPRMTRSGRIQGGERKRTTDEVSKRQRWRQNRRLMVWPYGLVYIGKFYRLKKFSSEDKSKLQMSCQHLNFCWATNELRLPVDRWTFLCLWNSG
jgi:hypothetical protein